MKITTETAGSFLTHFSYDIETNPEKLKGVKKLSIEQRIDELYNGLTGMTSSGGPLFENMARVGGKIMGGIIKGAVLGITAAFHLLAGGVDKSVEALGLTITDEMRKDAASKGIKDMKKYTILNWLGIGATDADGLSKSLGDAVGDLVSKLPKMVDMAATIIEDLGEVLINFAASLLGLIGEGTIAVYDQANMAEQTLMKMDDVDIKVMMESDPLIGLVLLRRLLTKTFKTK